MSKGGFDSNIHEKQQKTKNFKKITVFTIVTLLVFSLVLNNAYALYTPNPNFNTVIKTIQVGNGPTGIGYDSNNKSIYVVNTQSNTTSVINTANQVSSTISVGSFPNGVAFNPSNDKIYVANDGDNTVSVIDDSTNQVVATITLGSGPEEFAYNPINKDMYVTKDDGTVDVINKNNQVIDTITVGPTPYGIIFNPVNNCIYVTNTGDGTISVINSSNKIIATIQSFPAGFLYMGFNSNNNNIYSTNGTTVTIITPSNDIVGVIPSFLVAWDLAFSPTSNEMYVTDNNNNTVDAINLQSKIVNTIPVRSGPFEIVFDSDNNYVYSVNNINGTVSVIDTNPQINGGGQKDTESYTKQPSNINFNLNVDNTQASAGQSAFINLYMNWQNTNQITISNISIPNYSPFTISKISLPMTISSDNTNSGHYQTNMFINIPSTMQSGTYNVPITVTASSNNVQYQAFGNIVLTVFSQPNSQQTTQQSNQLQYLNQPYTIMDQISSNLKSFISSWWPWK